MNPEISIILPFYKTPIMLLRKALDKLLEQSYSNFEILCINDGNSNEYDKLINEYTKKDSRIKFIYQKNSGVSSARNTGLKNAQGKYIVFHDADDFVENNYLYSLHKEIDNNVDLVICGMSAQWFPSVDSKLDIREFLSTPSIYNYVQYTNFTPNKIFKRDIIINNNIFFDTKIKLGEDALFICKYLNHVTVIRCISSRLYYYIPYENSATKKYEQNFWNYEKLVISEIMNIFTKYPLNDKEYQYLIYWLYTKIHNIIYYYLNNETDETTKKDIINNILYSDFFKIIKENYNQNQYFSKKDKRYIYLWSIFNFSGVNTLYNTSSFSLKIRNRRKKLSKKLRKLI